MELYDLINVGKAGSGELLKQGSDYAELLPDDSHGIRMNRNCYNSGIRYLYYHKADHALLVSYLGDRKVHIFNLGTGLLRMHSLHSRTVRNLMVHNDEIISTSWDGSVKLVNYYSLRERISLSGLKIGRSPHSIVSEDGDYIYTFNYDSDFDPLCEQNNVRKWRVSDGLLEGVISQTGNHIGVTRSGMCIEYQGVLYVISNSGYLTAFRINDLEKIDSLFIARNLRTFCISPEYGLLLINDISGVVFFYDINLGMVVFRMRCHIGDISTIRIIPWSGDHFCTISSDGNTKIWNLPHRSCVSLCKRSEYSLWSMDFIDRLLLTGGEGGQIDVFDLSNLSHPEFVASISIYNNSVAVFPATGKMYFANNNEHIEVFDKSTDLPVKGKIAEYQRYSLNSLKVLDDVFGNKQRSIFLSGQPHNLRLQLPLTNK